ncbi:4'-phosphopantetheinyl transferase [Marinomonas posidonica IVIA-Po-181]|uniref:4'-phosphopantetheinyl transferase n=2 Tax=Marinomonas TaxID=28253 RepID=F6CZU3_MARPP|nr:4'-phosphopantetheinyl transferase [Marinomonas posidonica IVIA-Po-181]
MISISLLDLSKCNLNSPENCVNYLIPKQLNYFNKIKSEKRRMEYLWSRILINKLILSLKSKAFLLDSYRDTEYGPVLLNSKENFFLSLSHSSDAIVVAVSDFPVGVDVELMKRRDNYRDMAKLFMTSRELKDFDHQSVDHQKKYFYNLWVSKEAIFKSLPKHEQPGLSLANIAINSFQGSVVFFSCLSGGYAMAIAVK